MKRFTLCFDPTA